MIQNNPIRWANRFRRNKCQWPSPEASTGIFYRKMGRDSSCWEAVGAARETFIRIADEIKDHLEKASEPVPQAVTWTMYMIGKTKETAEPMILFCCRESASRKQVRTTVEESGILLRYPGVRVGDASRPPDFDQLVQLAGEASDSLNLGQNTKMERLEFRCEADGSLYANRNHLGSEVECVMGNQIFVTLPGNDGARRKATIGGIVQSDSTQFYLTAGHAFESPRPEVLEDNGGDFDFDIGEESDLGAEEDFIDSTSRGSLTPERADYSSSDDLSTSVGAHTDISPSSTGKSVSREPPGELNYNTDAADSGYGSAMPRDIASRKNKAYVGEILRPRQNRHRPTLDYALIEITRSHFIEWGRVIADNRSILPTWRNPLVPFTTIDFVPQNTQILAITGSGRILEGTISGTPTYNTACSNKVHELWTIRLDGRLEEGDCGSWVVGVGSGVFYGHIIAGSPESGAAYVVPAYQIFRDAKYRFGVDLQLPTKKPTEVEEGRLAINPAPIAASKAGTTSESISYSPPILSASRSNPMKPGNDLSEDGYRGRKGKSKELLSWGHERKLSGGNSEQAPNMDVKVEGGRAKVGSLTPPRSPSRSKAKNEIDLLTERRRQSQMPMAPPRAHRQYRKERVIIVDSPPAPRSPPPQFYQTFTPPSSNATPETPEEDMWRMKALPSSVPAREMGRPIIVDERPLRRARVDAVPAVVGRRTRSQSRTRFQWDSPSSSHTSLDSRARHKAEEIELSEEKRRRAALDEQIAYLEAGRRREERTKQQDEGIRRRPPVPLPPTPLRQREFLRPVIDQTSTLQGKIGNLGLGDSVEERVLINDAETRRRMEERDRALRARLAMEEEEALKQRLRERQMPKRRFSVGPGERRHRVVYEDGIYRWE